MMIKELKPVNTRRIKKLLTITSNDEIKKTEDMGKDKRIEKLESLLRAAHIELIDLKDEIEDYDTVSDERAMQMRENVLSQLRKMPKDKAASIAYTVYDEKYINTLDEESEKLGDAVRDAVSEYLKENNLPLAEFHTRE